MSGITLFLPQIDENTLSSHREGQCEDPYPIYTIIDQDSKYAKLDEKGILILEQYSCVELFHVEQKKGNQMGVVL